jgi:hypothetical protein
VITLHSLRCSRNSVEARDPRPLSSILRTNPYYLLPDSFGNALKCPRSVQASYPAAKTELRKSLILKRAGNRVRTDDLLITNQLLYQLSYAGFSGGEMIPAVAPASKRNLGCRRATPATSPCHRMSATARPFPGRRWSPPSELRMPATRILLLVATARQTEVDDPEKTLAIDQQIAQMHIAVNDSLAM